MSSLKLRHFLIFLVFALLLGVWAARIQLSEFAITSSMQAYGLKNITTEINRLGLNQSHMPRFEFLLKADTGYFQLEAYDLNLRFLDTIHSSLSPKIKDSKYGKELESFIKSRKQE